MKRGNVTNFRTLFFPPEKQVLLMMPDGNNSGKMKKMEGVFFRWNTNFHVLTFLFIIRLKSCR